VIKSVQEMTFFVCVTSDSVSGLCEKRSRSDWLVFGMKLGCFVLTSSLTLMECFGEHGVGSVCECIRVHALISTSLVVPSALVPKAAYTVCPR